MNTTETRTNKLSEKTDFYRHLSAYIVVNAMLIVINLVTSPDTIWFIWPLAGWGVGLLLHGLNVFAFSSE